MNQNTSLKIVLGISVVGMLFSGYLSYSELARETCPLGGCSSLLGVPTCVYGFVMYTIEDFDYLFKFCVGYFSSCFSGVSFVFTVFLLCFSFSCFVSSLLCIIFFLR